MTGNRTHIWCPNCGEISSTKVINKPFDHRQYFVNGHEDIHYFRRLRECERCLTTFETAEVDIALLNKLVDFREGTVGLSKQIGALIRVKRTLESRMDVSNATIIGKVIDWLITLKSQRIKGDC